MDTERSLNEMQKLYRLNYYGRFFWFYGV